MVSVVVLVGWKSTAAEDEDQDRDEDNGKDPASNTAAGGLPRVPRTTDVFPRRRRQRLFLVYVSLRVGPIDRGDRGLHHGNAKESSNGERRDARGGTVVGAKAQSTTRDRAC